MGVLGYPFVLPDMVGGNAYANDGEASQWDEAAGPNGTGVPQRIPDDGGDNDNATFGGRDSADAGGGGGWSASGGGGSFFFGELPSKELFIRCQNAWTCCILSPICAVFVPLLSASLLLYLSPALTFLCFPFSPSFLPCTNRGNEKDDVRAQAPIESINMRLSIAQEDGVSGSGSGVRARVLRARALRRWCFANALLPAVQFSVAPWRYDARTSSACLSALRIRDARMPQLQATHAPKRASTRAHAHAHARAHARAHMHAHTHRGADTQPRTRANARIALAPPCTLLKLSRAQRPRAAQLRIRTPTPTLTSTCCSPCKHAWARANGAQGSIKLRSCACAFQSFSMHTLPTISLFILVRFLAASAGARGGGGGVAAADGAAALGLRPQGARFAFWVSAL
eukprot:5494502-Pleurochrysis_carterae.AAC.1